MTGGSLPQKTRTYICERDDYTCWRCGAEQDHLLPRNRGGTDDEWNLALACQPCNLGRRDRVEVDALDLANRQKLEWHGFVP